MRPQLLRQLKAGRGWFPTFSIWAIGSRKLRKPIVTRLATQHPLYLWRIGEPMVFSDNSPEILQPQPTRNAPLIIEVR